MAGFASAIVLINHIASRIIPNRVLTRFFIDSIIFTIPEEGGDFVILILTNPYVSIYDSSDIQIKYFPIYIGHHHDQILFYAYHKALYPIHTSCKRNGSFSVFHLIFSLFGHCQQTVHISFCDDMNIICGNSKNRLYVCDV